MSSSLNSVENFKNSSSELRSNFNNILVDDFPECPYVAAKKKNRAKDLPDDLKNLEYNTVHWGQRKLCLSEIEFLTEYVKDNKDIKYLVLYPGSARGDHIPLLHKYFNIHSDVEFHLYDPAPFCNELTSDLRYKINIHKDSKLPLGFFTDEIAEIYKNEYSDKYHILFISDIRLPPSDVKKEDTFYSEKFQDNVAEDMLKQKTWVEMINPVSSMLKLCFPYESDSIVKYFDGNIHNQCWAPSTSTERRLIITNKNKIKNISDTMSATQSLLGREHPKTVYKEYIPIKYEKQCAYFNIYQRMLDISNIDIDFNKEINVKGKFKDIWNDYKIFIGADCYIETLIIYKLIFYLNKDSIEITVNDIKKYIDQISLQIYPHINPKQSFSYKIKLNKVKRGN
jgi:hypothetical protein